MYDVEVPAPDGARSVRRIGEVLGAAGVSLDGGGVWAGVAHYLVADGEGAQSALEGDGIRHGVIREAVLAELDADVPGALGRMMALLEAGEVTLLAQYSDHDNRKVLVTDDPAEARRALGIG